MQATDGNFYGTTYAGGAYSDPSCPNGCGTVFKITPTGALTTLYSFCAQSGCPDGRNPLAELVQATDGSLYGATAFGGAISLSGGTVFQDHSDRHIDYAPQFQRQRRKFCLWRASAS